MSKLELEDNRYCFACGMDNPDGLRLDWKIDGQAMVTEFTPPQKYQGWKGIVHGGVLATLLDESMTRLAWIVCGAAVTAEMKIRYVTPANIGEKLYVRGEIVKESPRLIETRAFIYKEDESGLLIAHATGKAMRVS